MLIGTRPKRVGKRVDCQRRLISRCTAILNSYACEFCADGMTRLEDIFERLWSLTRSAAPAAVMTAASAVASVQQSSFLGPAFAGVAMVFGVAVGVPRLMQWRYPAPHSATQVQRPALSSD